VAVRAGYSLFLGSEVMEKESSISILLVEDNRLIAFSLKDELESFGYNVHVAYSVDDAIKSAKILNPGLILMDVNLNDEKDGIDCMKAINGEVGFIPNIYLSGYDREDVRVRANETSPIEILEQPVKTAQLVSIIEAMS